MINQPHQFHFHVDGSLQPKLNMHTDTRTSSKLHKHLLEIGYTLGYFGKNKTHKILII